MIYSEETFYTLAELVEHLRVMLAYIRADKLTFTDLFSACNVKKIKIKCASDNSIQGEYYGIKFNIRVKHTKTGTILLSY